MINLKNSINFYNDNGYYVSENVFSDNECELIIKEGESLNGFKGGDFKTAMQPHLENSFFKKIAGSEYIKKFISTLFGNEAQGIQTQFFYSIPGVSGFTPHQDNYFVEADENNFCSAWIALVDVNIENGCLYGYKYSHKNGLLPRIQSKKTEDKNQDVNAYSEITVLPDGLETINIPVKKGSVVFLHGSFVHGSLPNLGTYNRYALLCTYIKKGAYFRPGNHAKRTAFDLI
jgi:ectoine hydroxylase-related dioxygenase (phytanoyl-CoA dioxygenase family)